MLIFDGKRNPAKATTTTKQCTKIPQLTKQLNNSYLDPSSVKAIFDLCKKAIFVREDIIQSVLELVRDKDNLVIGRLLEVINN